MQTAVYLVHFKQPFKHARHYLGFVEDAKKVIDRLHRHLNGNGAALTRAAAAAGVEFVLVRTWKAKSRRFERRLKLQKHSPQLCPVCNPTGYANRTKFTPDALPGSVLRPGRNAQAGPSLSLPRSYDMNSANANSKHAHEPLFPLGRVVITLAALDALDEQDVRTALGRHAGGDWGDLDLHDIQENELALEQGLRLLSAYRSSRRVTFWIITEADRSSTCILLPEDY